jgi:hypothetical protein
MFQFIRYGCFPSFCFLQWFILIGPSPKRIFFGGYWEHNEEHIGNLGNPLGTLWEDIKSRKKTNKLFFQFEIYTDYIFFQLYIKIYSQFNLSRLFWLGPISTPSPGWVGGPFRLPSPGWVGGPFRLPSPGWVGGPFRLPHRLSWGPISTPSPVELGQTLLGWGPFGLPFSTQFSI